MHCVHCVRRNYLRRQSFLIPTRFVQFFAKVVDRYIVLRFLDTQCSRHDNHHLNPTRIHHVIRMKIHHVNPMKFHRKRIHRNHYYRIRCFRNSSHQLMVLHMNQMVVDMIVWVVGKILLVAQQLREQPKRQRLSAMEMKKEIY